MELIHANMRKSASLRGGICFIKEAASEAKFIFNFQNFGNEVKIFNCREETYVFVFFFQYLVHNTAEKKKVKSP